MSHNNLSDLFGEIISTYTRAQALADGALVDVSKEAAKVGFKIPVAVTNTVWGLYNFSTENEEHQTPFTSLWALKLAIIEKGYDQNELEYELKFPSSYKEGNSSSSSISLKALLHAGDEGEPVITIMMPYED